jgi:hypothetical protein
VAGKGNEQLSVRATVHAASAADVPMHHEVAQAVRFDMCFNKNRLRMH